MSGPRDTFAGGDGEEGPVTGSARDFAVRLGDHLRRIRQQKGLSLQDVEAASAKEFKASIVGAYERGERSVTATRLWRLADLYSVPLSALLPAQDAPVAPSAATGITVHLGKLKSTDAPEARALWGYARSLQALRGDWAAEVITFRASDVYAVAGALERTPEELLRRLDELGLRASPSG